MAENTGRPAAMIGISQRPSGPGGLMGQVARRAGHALVGPGRGGGGRMLGECWASAGQALVERRTSAGRARRLLVERRPSWSNSLGMVLKCGGLDRIIDHPGAASR